EADVRVELSLLQPIACLYGAGGRGLIVRPRESERFARAEPLPMCQLVRLRDVAWDRPTLQSSAAGAINPFTVMTRWMAPTQAEPRPWWEIDLGAASYVDHVRLHCPTAIAGVA